MKTSKKSKQLDLLEHTEVTDEDKYLKSLVLQRTILRTKLNNIEKEIQALEKSTFINTKI